MKKIKPSLLPAIVWIILSVFLLTIPGSALPKENWLGKIWFDKWVHIGMFGIMVWLFCWAIQSKKIGSKKLINAFVITATICLAYGIAMEYVQKYFVVNRSFDNGDIVADAIGCTVGFLYSSKKYI